MDNLLDFLLDFLQALPPKPIVEKLRMRRTKVANVVRQGLAPHFKQNLIETLSSTAFSVIIDETTDVSTTKQLVICVSFCDEDLSTEVDLLDIVDCPDGTANGVFTQLDNVLTTSGIPLKNWIGFCADTTNSMMGIKHSVSTLITAKYPWVKIVKCSCHSISLASSYACAKLPKSLEDLAREIPSHFAHSAKRKDEFRQFQEFFNVADHKILKLATTRWLSFENCAKRILEQWTALEGYFNLLAAEDPTRTNDLVASTLRNPLMKVMLMFAANGTGLLNEFNTQFQADKPIFYALPAEVDKLLGTLALNFMDPTYVKYTPKHSIDVTAEEYYVPLGRVYLGIDAHATLSELLTSNGAFQDVEVDKIYYAAREFYKEAILQIQKRFTLEDEIYNDIAILSPDNAQQLNPPSLGPLLSKFNMPGLDAAKVDSEWRAQSLVSAPPEVLGDVLKYWRNIFSLRSPTNQPMFHFFCV